MNRENIKKCAQNKFISKIVFKNSLILLDFGRKISEKSGKSQEIFLQDLNRHPEREPIKQIILS